MSPFIPGAREVSPTLRRQAGAMGGAANGSDARSGDGSLDAATILEREREGGGGTSQRPPPSRRHAAGDSR